jgi:rhodanese-related sulfurtransferase
MNISPIELKKRLDLRKDGKADFILLDVRNPNEQDVAIIEGTDLLIPVGELDFRLEELDKYKSIDKEIIVYCRSGGRSTTAMGKLKRSGFNKVFNLEGGILSYSDEVDSNIAKY